MNNQKINVWGRDFHLDIFYEAFNGEQISDFQKESLNKFLENASVINTCKDEVKKYCVENSNGEIKTVDNIFKYVIPTTLNVLRDNETRTIEIICNFKFDIEHGLVIVFKNEKFSEIVEEGTVV